MPQDGPGITQEFASVESRVPVGTERGFSPKPNRWESEKSRRSYSEFLLHIRVDFQPQCLKGHKRTLASQKCDIFHIQAVVKNVSGAVIRNSLHPQVVQLGPPSPPPHWILLQSQILSSEWKFKHTPRCEWRSFREEDGPRRKRRERSPD